jgi:hypothetical protein
MKYFFQNRLKAGLVLILILQVFVYGCRSKPGGPVSMTNIAPVIEPDYTGLTIPPNIAPLNFIIREKGETYSVRIHSDNGPEINLSSRKAKIEIPAGKWKSLLQNNKGGILKTDILTRDKEGGWHEYNTITNNIAEEPIDKYLYYRILYPGYESWSSLSINYRDLENYKSEALIENSIVNENCVNCHAFNNTGKNKDFLFHMRGNMGGTYFYTGDTFKKINLKTKEMKNGAVYPRWHPSGKYVAFSSNKIIQRFHSADNKKIEVSDLESTLVLYDTGKNQMMNINTGNDGSYMDTYPEWSPDGKFLYFCRAERPKENYDYRLIRYNLYRIPFNAGTRTFGTASLVYDASAIGKSVAFPRVSPDGKYIAITLADYGCFPIWHKEADLYLLDTATYNPVKPGLNSDYTESYHSWSSNGFWLVFSSKRGDGLTARPYISYIRSDGTAGKPFILPQKDPAFYSNFLKTYNIPEFSNIKISVNPGKIRRSADSKAIQASWAGDQKGTK